MGLGRQDFSGKRVTAQEADAVIADLKKYLAEISDRWLIKGRFHSEMANGSLPMEAIKVFWQNWYGFVAEINNFHGVAYQRHLPFFKRHPELQKHFANHVERVAAKFWRSFSLPETIKQDSIEAAYKDGVLEVRIPKAEEAKPRQIEISVH